MATRTLALNTEELTMLYSILAEDKDRNAMPIAIEKGFGVSQYLNLTTKLEYLTRSAQKEDEYVLAKMKRDVE